MNLELSDLTVEFQDYVTQFEADLRTRNTIRGFLTTQTSQTLLELVASVGTLSTATLIRRFEDLFLETATNDNAIYAIAQMQGLRLQRKTPSFVTATIQASSNTTLPKWTQFQGGGTYFFSRVPITLLAGVPQTVTLYQGYVVSTEVSSLGTDFQSFITTEDKFNVSDVDVEVEVNGILIPRIIDEGLWTREGLEGYADSTLSDGRLIIQFGSQQFATIPQVDDVVKITYAITSGAAINNQPTANKKIQTYPLLFAQGEIDSNPSEGSDERPVIIYKNISPGAFGTYTSYITLDQYKEIALAYPDKDIRDVLVRPGRQSNSEAHKFMNVVFLLVLSDPPFMTWTQPDIDDFVAYMERNTMYSTKFAVSGVFSTLVVLNFEVYCKNSSNLADIEAKLQTAVGDIFEPKSGSIGLSLYESDIIQVCNRAAPGEIEYIKFLPTGNNLPVRSTPLPSTNLRISINAGVSSLAPGNYAYCVIGYDASTFNQSVAEWIYVTVETGQVVNLSWDPVPSATEYQIYGGLANADSNYWLVTAGFSVFNYTDTGSIAPNGQIPFADDTILFSYPEAVYILIKAKHSGRPARQL